jgi:hypothetical protein
MKATIDKEKLSRSDLSQMVLLLPHCLRPSQTCPGKFDKKGLICPEDCSEDCILKRLKDAALQMGYKGVCIAAGGAMALRFIEEHNPLGIVAVACDKELTKGVEGVEGMIKDEQEAPTIMIIPLLRDGCVDTEVEEDQVLKVIKSGCTL